MVTHNLPKKPANDKPLPVIAFIHGGAWRAGDKKGGFTRLREFVESGHYAGVSIGYRLTDQATWPTQIHDCKAAIRWIRGNAKKYNLDPDHIGVIGPSAGGHLVAMLGTSGGVAELEGKLGKYLDQSSKVTCVVDEFGPTELLMMSKFPSRIDHDSPNSPESKLVGGAIQEKKEAARSAS
ncbi:alpha/beta hydrolase fold domain-containing protein, partial [Nocardioides sp.]|uniref:alpha/beta hydrolase fold domain-containing protein n=1 Tax=Nocardioides sp. TaxID=35761 RepID=UPI003D10F846